MFAHPADIVLKCGIDFLETKEIASLSIEPDSKADPLVFYVFQISVTELDAFYRREVMNAFENYTKCTMDTIYRYGIIRLCTCTCE